MSPSIVVVDDIPLTLDFIRYHLEYAGYKQIITHDSPFESLRFLKSTDSVSVIISDFEMPGMNGLEFLNKVRTLHPWTPAVIATCDPESANLSNSQYPVLDKGQDTFIGELINFLTMIVKVDSPFSSSPTLFEVPSLTPLQ